MWPSLTKAGFCFRGRWRNCVTTLARCSCGEVIPVRVFPIMACTPRCGRSLSPWSAQPAPQNDQVNSQMIWSILKKDWALLWPLAVLVTLIQIAYEWAVYKFGFFGASPLAQELMRLLTPAWLIGVVALSVAVVYEDTVPGVDQDWLIRPLQRGDLLAAK